MNSIVQEIQNRGLNIEDVNLNECEVCDECATILLPDDECYSEFESDKPLCRECCFYDEHICSYIRGSIEASHRKLRVQIDVS